VSIVSNPSSYIGLVLLGDRESRLNEFPFRKVQAGEVLIKVRSAGICGSDLHFYRSSSSELGIRQNVVIGHEPCGIVVDVGKNVSNVSIGDSVVVNHTLGCNDCEHCFVGETVLCQQNIGMAAAGRGADAEYCFMPSRNCFRLPNDFSFIVGSFIGCTGATAFNIVTKLNPSEGHSLLVIGLGPVGLSVILIAKALGFQVFASDLNTDRLLLSKSIGASDIINANELNSHSSSSLSQPKFDYVIETSGAVEAQSKAIDVVKPKGTVAYIGLNSGIKSISPEQFIHKQATLIGSKVMPSNLILSFFNFISEKNIKFESLVTHKLALADGPKAFSLFDSGIAGKFILYN
jgi:threonine dehydrogenase-like Zn-dependent dehydrogenase